MWLGVDRSGAGTESRRRVLVALAVALLLLGPVASTTGTSLDGEAQARTGLAPGQDGRETALDALASDPTGRAAGSIIQAARDAGPEPPLARALAVVAEGTRWQAEALGLKLEETPRDPVRGSGFTSEAVFRLLDAQGVQVEEDERRAIRSLDRLPQGLSGDLSGVFDAFRVLVSTTQEAYSEADWEYLARLEAAMEHEDLLQALLSTDRTLWGVDPVDLPGATLERSGLDLGSVVLARAAFLDAVEDLSSQVDALGGPGALGTDCDIGIAVPPVLSVSLSVCDDVYEEDFMLLVDLGGDDVYLNNAGGNNVWSETLGYPCELPNPGLVAALVDLHGDDQYGDPEDPRGCGVNGGASRGVGLLVDGGGQDGFYGASEGVNGGAYGQSLALLVAAGGGDDAFYGERVGVNGGSRSQSMGMVVAGEGNKTFVSSGGSEDQGANGGGWFGPGLLVSLGGGDEYLSGGRATNGGAANFGQGMLVDLSGDDVYEGGAAGTNGEGATGIGLLVDLDGEDRYMDTLVRCLDCTLVPKGSGAQVDWPNQPGDPVTGLDPFPPPEGGPGPFEPRVVVGVPDTGVNVYHEIYFRPERTQEPCTYLEGFPCGLPALELSVGGDDWQSMFEADLDVWESIEPGTWYWIPQTVFVAVYCEDGQTEAQGGAYCILDDGNMHGTGTTSSVLMENPEALIAFKSGGSSIWPFEQGHIPVDVFSVSWGSVAPIPMPFAPGPTAPIYVVPSGNHPRSTIVDRWSGNPNNIAVGGGYAADGTEELFAGKHADVVSYFCRPTADTMTVSGYRESFCGTSFATPTVAGALSKVILGLRKSSGYTGGLTAEGSVDPGSGVSISALREALNRTASYDPDPQYDNKGDYVLGQPLGQPLPSGVPVVQEAPWLQWGWGFYDGTVANATLEHLLGEVAPPKPPEAKLWMDSVYRARSLMYGPAPDA